MSDRHAPAGSTPVREAPLFGRAAPPVAAPDPIAGAARAGTLLGMAAAVTWIALGLESTVRGGEMHYRDALWLLPWILTSATFAAVYRVQRERMSPSGRRAAYGLAGAMVLLLVGNLGLALGVDGLAFLGFPVGATLWLLLMIPFGVATVRAGVLPRRVGIAIALLEPGSMLTGLLLSPIAGLYDRGNYSGGIEKGLVVLVVALALSALHRRRSERT